MKYAFSLTAIALLPFAALAAPTSAPPLELPSTNGQSAVQGGSAHWSSIDTNGDGVITKDEFMAASEKRFKEMDLDGDGKLSRVEWKAYNQGMKAKSPDAKAATPEEKKP